MEEGKTYDVTVAHVFTGIYEGEATDDYGRKIAVFKTDSAGGSPKQASGRRAIQVERLIETRER